MWRLYGDVNLKHRIIQQSDSAADDGFLWHCDEVNSCINFTIISYRVPVGPGRCMWGSVDGVQPYAFWASSRKHGKYLSKSPLSVIFLENNSHMGLSEIV